MKLTGKHDYLVIAYGGSEIRTCRFRRKSQHYELTRQSSEPFQPDNPGESLKRALSQCGGSSASCVILAGPMQDGVLFHCPGAALPVREQKNALQFELPLHMLEVPDKCTIQYVRTEDNNLTVYAYPSSSMNRAAAMLTGGHCKADEFLYPALGLKKDDPAAYLPSLEPDFHISGGEWRPGKTLPANTAEKWKEIFSPKFVMPSDFDFMKNLDILLIMRLMTDPSFRKEEAGAAVLPNQLKPGRCRFQVLLMVLLCAVLAVGWLWGVVCHRLEVYAEYKALMQQRDNYKRKTINLKNQLKKSEKESKELIRIAKMNAGDPALLNKLYNISMVLPSASLVTSFRFNDGTFDLVIQSDAEVNIAQGLRKLSGWKIAELQQRSMGQDSVSMTIVRLEPESRAEK